MVLDKTLESPLDCKEIQPVHLEGDQSWVFIGRTDAEAKTKYFVWCQELTYWKWPWCWEGLRAGGEGDNRGWDGWMASPTWWRWVWVDSGRWWWTGRPGMLWFMGSQRVRHNWVTELNWKNYNVLGFYDTLSLIPTVVACLHDDNHQYHSPLEREGLLLFLLESGLVLATLTNTV